MTKRKNNSMTRQAERTLAMANRARQLQNSFHSLTASVNHLDRTGEPLHIAMTNMEQARVIVLSSLRYAYTSDWTASLTGLRTEFTTAAQIARDAAQKFRQDMAPYGANIAAIISREEKLIMDVFTQVDEALSAAIVRGDGGAALHKLAQQHGSPLGSAIKNFYSDLSTDNLAADRRMKGAARFIGYHACRLERDGITRTKQQWQQIYAMLNTDPTRDDSPDKLDAWDWLTGYDPQNLTGKALRQFEQEISRMKREMKPEFDAR